MTTRPITRRALIGGGVSLALLAPLLAACSDGASSASPSPKRTKLGPATLRFSSYGNDQKMQIRGGLAAKFTQSHPDITMVFEGSPSDSYFAKLATQIAGGNAPDVINLDTGHMSQYAPKGALATLSPYIPSYIDASAFSKDLLQLGQIDGKQYGMPVATTSFGWTWDTDLFDEIGVKAPDGTTWTWDDMAELSNTIWDKSNGKYHGNADPSGDPYTFEMWLRSHGHSVYGSATKLGYDADAMGEWFDYWAKLRKSGGIPPADITAEETPYVWEKAALVNKVAAMSFSNTGVWAGAYAALTKDTLALTTPPKAKKGDKNPNYPLASSYFALNSKCKAPDQAAEFIDWFVNSKTAAETLRLISGPPASQKAVKAVDALTDLTPVEKTVLDYTAVALKHGTPAPKVPVPAADQQIGTFLLKASQDVAFKRQSVSQAVSTFMSSAKSALATSAIS
jgi:multiple sugar transport system substrate-binding protein